MLKWKLDLVLLEIVLILTQDGCMVYVERTICLKSFWTHPIELLADVGLMEPISGPFGDSVR